VVIRLLALLMIDSFNSFLTSVIDWILYPFSGCPKLWGLVYLSLLAGVLFLLCYGQVSNQKAIKNVKRKIFASLYESVLFRHDLKTCLKAQWRMLIGGAVYFCLAVPPIIVLMIPCVLLLAQINLRYDSNGLIPHQAAIIRVNVTEQVALNEIKLSLAGAGASTVEITPKLRDLENNEAVWRIVPTEKTSFEVNISLKDETYSLPVVVESEKTLHLQSSLVKNMWESFFYPDRPRIPEKSLISAISVTYPSVDYNWLGISWNWLVLFFILSVISGLVAGKIFGISV